MKDLLQISITTIGTEQVNSVNAREIHQYLGVKTHLSTWIKRAIEKYDFEEGIDFSVLKSGNPNGGLQKIDYVVTIDMAKELSMLENNPKGKETRKYFIQAEKHLSQQKLMSPTEMILLQAQEVVKIEQKQKEHDDRLQLLEDSKVINSRQRYALKKAVSAKTYKLKEQHSMSDEWIRKGHMKLWKLLKDRYHVSSYMDIPAVKFEESLNIINSATIEDII